MGGARLLGVALGAAAVLLLAGPPTSRAADPPNPNDPCISGTRNICGTTGVGSYETYRYGTRWFGDFRNVVPGQFHMYCIDLRFWYPGPDYDYKEVPADRPPEPGQRADSGLEPPEDRVRDLDVRPHHG